MKSQKILFILLVSCLLTGCGQRIEQTAPETLPESAALAEIQTSSESAVTTKPKSTTTRTKKTNIILMPETEISDSVSESTVSSLITEHTSISASSGTASTTATSPKSETVPNTTAIKATDPAIPKNTASSAKKTSAAQSSATTFTTTVTSIDSTPPMTEPVTEEITDAPETVPETDPVPTRKTGSVSEIMSMMTLEEKIYQLFIVTPEVLTGAGTVTMAGTTTQNAIASQPVAGLIYFADNLVSTSQTTAMLTNTQNYAQESGIGMFLSVDEEGGLVARCAKKLGTTKLDPMAVYGKNNDWNEAFHVGEILGNSIHQFGFNLDFAPVADVNLNSGNELGTRIFSDDPEIVGNMVSGVVQGLQNTGVAATLKHFPGLGAENGNAHTDEKIIIDRTLDDLRNAEFIPFRYGIEAGADFVMVSHQIITGAGDGLPSCLSPVICTDLLRNELGFDGILITDAFNMNTISGTYSPGNAAVMAIQAGVDIILMPTDLTGSVQAIKNAVNSGLISESRIDQSVERILLEKEKLNLLG